jgi:hypothetical protein
VPGAGTIDRRALVGRLGRDLPGRPESPGDDGLSCLRSADRERYLGVSFPPDLSQDSFSTAHVGDFALAGDYLAFTSFYETDYHGAVLSSVSEIHVLDLLSGRETLVAPNVDLPYGSTPQPGFRFTLALSPHGFIAWETVVPEAATASAPQPPDDETILAHDGRGMRTLDHETVPQGSAAGLANLAITGDTVTWTHDGQPMSATLGP